MAKTAEQLPDDTQPRLRILVERSAPNPDRPKLENEEHEAAFGPVDRANAACYASAEDLSDRLRKSAVHTTEIACLKVWPPGED